MSFLVDTNILSELSRPAPNPGVIVWVRHLTTISLSAITVEEIYFGLEWRPSPRIQQWFHAFLRQYCQVLPITGPIAIRSGELRGRLRTQGKPRTQADMLIAATASVHDLTLVTRNLRDFDGCGIPLLNPFT